MPAKATTPAPRAVSVRTLVIAGVTLLSIVALAMVLRAVADTVLLLLVAIVFAEGISPLVSHFEALRMPRIGAILTVYVLLLAALALVIVLLVQPVVSEVQSLVNKFPSYQQSITHGFADIEARLHITTDVGGQIAGSLNTAKDVLLTVGGYVVSTVVNFIVILLLAFLWLTSSDRLKEFVVDLIPPGHQAEANDVLHEMGFRMGGYLQATAVNMVVVGVATGVAAWALRIPSPILIGIFAGLTGAVPLVGPFIGAIPPILLGFTIAPLYPLLVAAVVAVIQLLDANLVVPQVMNRVVALPALAVVLALLVGATLAGIAGALLAIPMAAALHVVVVRVVVPAVHAAQGRSGEARAEAARLSGPA